MVAPALVPIKIGLPPADKAAGSHPASLSPTSARAPVDASDPDPAFHNWAPWIVAALKISCPGLPPATAAPALALALHGVDSPATALARVTSLHASLRNAGALGGYGGASVLHASLVADPAATDFAALATAAAAATAADPATLISLVPRAGAQTGPAAPPASVHIAVAVGSLARLSAAPCPPTPAFFAGDDTADEHAVAAYRARAGEDAVAFLRERAREATPGGLLLAVTPGTLGARSAFDGPLSAVRDAAAAGVAAGEVDGCLLKSFAAPLYSFTARELEAAAVATGDWVVLQRGAAALPGPLDALRVGSLSAEGYGDALAAEAAALLGPSLRDALGLTPAAEAALFARAAALAAADPARYAHRAVAAAILLQRKGGSVPRPRTGGRRDWFESRRRSTDM